MAASPFQFINRWVNSLGDLMRDLFPDRGPTVDMLMQLLEERDQALEAYLQRWLAPIAQVAAYGASVGPIVGTELTTASAALPIPTAAGVWRAEGYVDVQMLGATGGDVFIAYLRVGGVSVDNVTFTGVENGLARLSGFAYVTAQQIGAGTTVRTVTVSVKRGSGSVTGSVPADGGGSLHNRVSATFIPQNEGTT